MRWKKTIGALLFFLLFCTNVHAEESVNVEIFDISKEEIIKVVPLNPNIEKLTVNFLKDITGIYGKFNPIPVKGFAIKIPMDPSINFKAKYINNIPLEQVIIIFPKDEEPFLMVFESDNKLLCLTFKGNLNPLFKALNYKPSDYCLSFITRP